MDKARKIGVAISVHYAMGEAEEEISSLLRVNDGDNGTELQDCNMQAHWLENIHMPVSRHRWHRPIDCCLLCKKDGATFFRNRTQ